MAFNTGLSGLKAASTDLDVIGNNIANSATIGFKASRAEFHDVYAREILGGSSRSPGNGVLVQTIAQQFNQGNIKPTERNLDLAIDGTGFFIMRDNTGQTYTRQGIIGIDKNGNLINNRGSFLQGFAADGQGNIIPGILSDLQVGDQFQDPRQTSNIDISFNVDSREPVLERRGSTSAANGAIIGNAQAGTSNGYTAGSLDIQDISTTPATTISTVAIPSAANRSARAIAAELSNLSQVITASASTRVKVDVSTLPYGGAAPAGASITINGQAVSLASVNDASELATAIANLTDISASFVAPSEIRVFNNLGDDISVAISSTGTNVSVQGATGTTFTNAGAPVVVADGGAATVGGEVNFQVEENFQLVTPTLPATASNVFNFPLAYVPFIENSFDPIDPDTYNHATQVEVFDSLGNAHNATLYFVKERASTVNPNVTEWSLFVQVDGQDVGDPVVPGGAATRARYSVQFDREGNLIDPPPSIVITNWTPLDADGIPITALGPINTSAGGDVLPLPDPPTSSNFVIDIENSTQFGNAFAVDSLTQNGFAVGNITELDVDDEGIVFARYSNGQTSLLGQVALANFANNQGLTPIGNTSWAQSFASGEPVIGSPQAGVFGGIRSGTLEEANVDIAEQLVNLIIAQRNYQANAKTIETEDAITQTIINLR
ncbi:flagellar hook protein FlgE [Zooshikella marina]|uniref:flagellar hook protein FlgE n=1 Tax=Zooshikella ganghwensis TaxID=202772 RepID=UPI001BAF672B|nr:flagellar hook protein FlgE [Zooshikella ganghwensis]MBU2704573.1 flagellar hook protein FlgE [Zooshikella ganghwensis]